MKEYLNNVLFRGKGSDAHSECEHIISYLDIEYIPKGKECFNEVLFIVTEIHSQYHI